MTENAKPAFDRHAFKDLPFDVAAYDRLIARIMARPDFPKTKNIREIVPYLQANPIKVFVLGSYYRGYNLINALNFARTLDQEVREARDFQGFAMHAKFHKQLFRSCVKIVGVATDDVDSNFIGKSKRIWRYPEAQAKKDMVPNLVEKMNAAGANIPLWKARVKTPEFNEFIKDLDPDIAFMGTFGQKIDQERIDLFPAGIFNFHPVGEIQWPHPLDSGPQPFEAMIARDTMHTRIAMHVTNTEMDDGQIMGISSAVRIPEGAEPPELHKLTSPYVREPLQGYFADMFYRLFWDVSANPGYQDAKDNHKPGIFLAPETP